jgi:hypothetical protein
MKMNKKLMIAIPVLAGVLALGTGAGVAFARSAEQNSSYRLASEYATVAAPNPSDSPARVGYCGSGGMMGLGAGGGLVTPQVAKLLGTTVADLQTHLNSGKTLADLAAAKGVTSDKLIQTVMAPFNDQMALMLKYSYLTQDQIDNMTQQMKDRLQTLITSQLNGDDETGWGFMGNMMNGYRSANPQVPASTFAPQIGFGGMMGGYYNNTQQTPNSGVAPRSGGMMGRW